MNSFKLAVKKLNVRKARTAISIFTASLLFGVITIFIISFQVFLTDIFQVYEDATNGKIVLEVRGVSVEVTDNIERHGGYNLDSEVYRLKQEFVAIESSETADEIDTSSYEDNWRYMNAKLRTDEMYVTDERVFENFKQVEPLQADAIPILANYDIVARYAGIKFEGIAEIEKIAPNFIIEIPTQDTSLKFEVVGLLPTPGYYFYETDSNVFEIVRPMNYSREITVPKAYKDRLGQFYDLEELKPISPEEVPRLVGFDSFDKAYKFASEYTCAVEFDTGCPRDPAKYSADELFTSRFSIHNTRQRYIKSFRWIIGFFIFISVIILGLTFSKIFIDEKKTSAIFQAVGATRMDIFKVYLAYSLIVGLIVAILVQIIGYSGAFLIDLWQSQIATGRLAETIRGLYGGFKLSLFGFSSFALWTSVAAIAGTVISFLLNYDKILAKNIVDTLKED